MPTTYKTLGQISSSGAIGTYDPLYVVPATTSTLVSNIVVCNRSSSDQTFRISCSETTTPVAKEFIAYGVTIAANDTIPLVIGLTLDYGIGGDDIRYLLCSSTSASVSFSAFGAEIT